MSTSLNKILKVATRFSMLDDIDGLYKKMEEFAFFPRLTNSIEQRLFRS